MKKNAWFRRPRAAAAAAPALAAIAGLAAIAATAALGPAVRAGEEPSSAEARSAYSRRIAATYNYRYGAGQPFLPSNATTDNGQFLDPKSFLPASYCGHCHQQAHAEWRQSVHANSFRAPWYQKNVNLLVAEKGVEYSRHCEGCHNPIALFSGALTQGATVERSFDEDGVTCSVCHSIQKVDKRGTGSYVLAPPAALIDEAGRPVYGELPDRTILSHLDGHVKAVMKDFYRSAEFCSACHKAALPRMLNDYKWQRAFFTYDEWQISSFSRQSPLPFYTKPAAASCQSCHMPRGPLTGADYGRDAGTFASHRWLGGNSAVPQFYGYGEQMSQLVAFLRRDVFDVDLFALEQPGEEPVLALGSQPYRLRAGKPVTVTVVIQNKGIGHTHVPEQRDFYESWVQFEARDAAGHVLLDSGSLLPDGSLDPAAHSFTNRLINRQGTLNDLHQVWNNRIVAYNNTVASGRSQAVRYRFELPAGTRGPVTITARVNYRRFNQHFIDFGTDRHYRLPVIEMAARTRTLSLGENPADRSPSGNPLWMRWNNWGVATLDGQQYAASAAAFTRVTELRPDYADGYTNVALANFLWEKYELSRSSLERALGLAPGNARALYYLALVERNQGNLEAAIGDLRQVTAQFPDSRDAHRELGFSYYQQHNYALARAEYEAVQAIDPDDLSAHYNLSLLYRRLGMAPEARREAEAFADQKDDPTANIFALDYLRQHPEIASESVAWHTHVAGSSAPAGSGSH